MLKSSSRGGGKLGFFRTRRKEVEGTDEVEGVCNRVAKMMEHGICVGKEGSVNNSGNKRKERVLLKLKNYWH